jgi:hypothetical protein
MTSTTRFALAVLMSVLLLPGAVRTSNGDQAGLGTAASLAPTITIVGGSPTTRSGVLETTQRFTSNDLGLPDVVIRLHDDPTGCDGHRGLFRAVDDTAVIDLCFECEFLTLHELGHAWAHFNLDDTARQEFQRAVGASTWNSPDVPHNFRATEIAADAIAYGLLSTPATPGVIWERRCERFEELTGRPPPRPTDPVETTR